MTQEDINRLKGAKIGNITEDNGSTSIECTLVPPEGELESGPVMLVADGATLDDFTLNG